MNRTITNLCALTFLASQAGCSLLGGLASSAPIDPLGGSQAEAGKASPEAIAALEKTMAQNVENCERTLKLAEDKFTEAMALIDPASNEPTSALVDQVRAEKVDLSIEIASKDMPLPLMKDSLLEEGKTLPNPPKGAADQAKLQAFAKRSMKVQPLLTPLRSRVSAIGGAMSASYTAQCGMYPEAYARQFMAMKNSGDAPTAEMMALYKRLITGQKRQDAMTASTVALIGTLQAGFAGRDSKPIDKAVEAILEAKPMSLEATDQDVEAKLAKAKEELGSAEGAEIKGPPPSGGQGGGAGDLLAMAPGPVGDAVKGIEALQKGDFAGALKSASTLAPAPLGPIFGQIGSLFG